MRAKPQKKKLNKRAKSKKKSAKRRKKNGGKKVTRPDTWHKMRLVCVLFTFENNTGHMDQRTDRGTNGRTDGHDILKRCDGASKNALLTELLLS